MNLDELHKKTIQSFIKGREQQAEIAAAHSQTAKKAYLGNSRKTGWRDGVVPRVVGQIGKIGQHDTALLQTATIFDRRYERAKASADKAKLRLLRKPAATMKNEEVVTEGKKLDRLRAAGAAAIVTGATVLGAGLGGLKHATLKNNEQQGGRQVHGSSNTFVGAGAGAGLAAGVGANEVVGGGATLAAMLARRRAKRNEEYTQVLEQMILSLTGMELEELHEAVDGLTGATPKRANAVLNRRLGQYKEKKKIGDVEGAEKAYARWDRTATLVNRRERWPMPVPAALKNRNYWNL